MDTNNEKNANKSKHWHLREQEKKKKRKKILLSFSILGGAILVAGSIYFVLNLDKYIVPSHVWNDRNLILETRNSVTGEEREDYIEYQETLILDKPSNSGEFVELEEKLNDFIDVEYGEEIYSKGKAYLDKKAEELLKGDLTEDELKEELFTKVFEEDGYVYTFQDVIVTQKKDKYFYVPSVALDLYEDEFSKTDGQVVPLSRIESYATNYDEKTEETEIVYITVNPVAWEN